MTTEPVYGIVEFPDGLVCAKGALGQSAAIAVGGIEGSFELPGLPLWTDPEPDPLGHFLVAPIAAKTWKRGDKPMFWGRPTSYPQGISSVHQALMTFEVMKENERSEAGDKIYSAFPEWIALFDSYIELLTKRKNTLSGVHWAGSQRLALFRWNNQGKQEDAYDHTITPPVTIISSIEDRSLTADQFLKACALCSASRKPAIEYRIMLEAYQAMGDRDYRKVVIEAATAVELALTKAIQRELSKLGVSFIDGLLNKFRMLHGRFELARLVGIALPDKDYRAILIEPRNEVVHRARFPDGQKAAAALRAVEELLTLLSPEIGEDPGQM